MPAKYRTDLTADFVRSVLNYDSETGILSWRERPEYPRKWNTRYAGKVAGIIQPSGYVYIQVRGRVAYSGHRIAWLHFFGENPAAAIDHINGIRSDNRITNLRQASNSDNCCNKAKQRNNKSGFVGVHFDAQHRMWRATINKDGFRHDVGFFADPEIAATARSNFLESIHGKFVPNHTDRKRYPHGRDRKKIK